MAANSLNRETVRQALADTLETVLVGTGLPVYAVYNYQVGDFSDQSPVVVVTTRGTGRNVEEGTFDQTAAFTGKFSIFVFVAYTQKDDLGNVTQTEEDSEAVLDLIEKIITDRLIDDYSLGGVIDEILPDGESSIDAQNIGGTDYRVEFIPVIARKAHG